jgi:hypothetical protein
MELLSEAEKALLAKKEQQRLKHKESQAKYRASIAKEKVKEYNKTYYENKKNKIAEIEKKLISFNSSQPEPKPSVAVQTTPEANDDKTPSYKTRKTGLSDSTILEYLKKAESLQKIFHKKNLSDETKLELANLFLDEEFDEEVILNEMMFIKERVIDIIKKIRSIYINDNSFKSYINALVVITSHLKTIPDNVYQTLTKLAIKTNENVQIKRQDNVLEDKDKDKIISLAKEDVLLNLAKLKDVEEQLIYALYTLFPARRLDWRNMKIKENADDTNEGNYIITNNMQFIFNNYKTFKTYGKQIFDIEDKDLIDVINSYILVKELKEGDYLFHLMRSKHEPQKESFFSMRVSEVFEVVYGVKISVRFIRMSWSNYINTQQISFNEKQKYIRRMSHSLAESQRYFKLIPSVSS